MAKPWRSRMNCAVVCAFLLSHSAAVAWIGSRTSPNRNEAAHLAAGLYIWEFGRFDVYCVNPPLVKALASLPAAWGEARTDWTHYQAGLGARPEWALGADFVAVNDSGDLTWLRYFVMARWACLPFSVLTGYIVYRWSLGLYGGAAALLSLALWCSCPNALAWGATICPDVAATGLGTAACYLFWRWLRHPSWRSAMGTGLTLGLAELSKTTWIVLYAVWPAMWIGWEIVTGRWSWIAPRPSLCGAPTGVRSTTKQARSIIPAAMQLMTMLALSIYIVNWGYGFDGSGGKLGEFEFVSRLFAGGNEGGNRFRGSCLESVVVPWPKDYLRGIDLQRRDFEVGADSYLFDHWKHGGWWYYYLVAALLKIPLGTLALGFVAVALTAVHGRNDYRRNGRRSRYCAGWINELALLVPGIAVFVLISSQTGFSRYFRYVLPAFPFLHVWIGKAASSITLGSRCLGIAVIGLATWSVASSAMVFPHSMSYFNELAGDPAGGSRYLLDANIDWGQDMVYLSEWVHRHPEAAPLSIASFSTIDARHFGICCTLLSERVVARHAVDGAIDQLGPPPGWYAISVHRIRENAQWRRWFLSRKPVARIGYSTIIYHIRDCGAPSTEAAGNL